MYEEAEMYQGCNIFFRKRTCPFKTIFLFFFHEGAAKIISLHHGDHLNQLPNGICGISGIIIADLILTY